MRSGDDEYRGSSPGCIMAGMPLDSEAPLMEHDALQHSGESRTTSFREADFLGIAWLAVESPADW